MTFLVLKALLSGVIVAVVSEIAKRSPALGALVVSLPLVSILAVIWLWRDTSDPERIASLLVSTFWYILPSLPMFLAVPIMLRAGWGFWLSLGVGCALTVVLYIGMTWVLSRSGINI